MLMTTPTLSENDLVALINRVVRQVAPSFKFGYFDSEDILQQARLYALEGLPRYNPERGTLESFLYTHIRFQLINLHRKHLKRTDPPDCPETDKRYKNWEQRNKVKTSLASPMDIANVFLKPDYDNGNEAEARSELIGIIENNLDIELRADFKRVLDGATVPKQRRRRLFESIKVIFRECINAED